MRLKEVLKEFRGAGGGGCFAHGTRVTVPDHFNHQRYIEDLKVGDPVNSFDMMGKWRVDEVVAIDDHEEDALLRVLFKDGTDLIVTPNHYFLLTNNSFGEIGDFEVEQSVVREDGQPIEIVGVEPAGVGPSRTFKVKHNFSFVANDIRVHNGGGGKGGSGGTAHVPVEDPNTLQSKNVAKVIDLLSEGPIVGLENGLKDVFLDFTPIQNEDDSYNFSGLALQERRGYPDQDPLFGFDEQESEVNVGVKVTNTSPVVRTISDASIDATRVTIQLSALSQQDTNDGDLHGYHVEFRIEVQPNGGSYFIPTEFGGADVELKGKTTSPYRRAFRFKLPGEAPWNIRVTRVSPDNSGDVTIRDEIFWTTYTEIIEERVMFMDRSVMGVHIDAQQFGNAAPVRSYLIKGRIISVPSNYDPDTRTYDGVWDGTFKQAWTDNPAWCVYDMVTHDRYGLGRDIPPQFMDKFTMYTIGQYCDELVDDGKGGTEPRFTMNAVIATREEAFTLLTIMGSVFRGQLFWGGSSVTATQDSPTDVSRVVSPANVVDGNFNYSGSKLTDRHSVVRVGWTNPDLNYGPDYEQVEDPEMIELFGIRDVDVAAFGCTSRGQANRFGKWIIDTEKYGSEIVTYQPKADHEDTLPGEVVAINDPMRAGVEFGGRVVEATTSVITLDRTVTLSMGETYTLFIILPDHSVVEADVTDGPGDYTVLTVSPALAGAPNKEAMWVLAGSNVQPTKWRVVQNQEDDKGIRTITGVWHDDNKYDRVESGLAFETVPTSLIPQGALPKVSELRFEEYLYKDATSNNAPLLTGGVLTWTPVEDVRVQRYVCEKRNLTRDTEWEELGTTQVPTFDFRPLEVGHQYVFRVRPAGFGKGLNVVTATQTILGKLDPPDDVGNFRMTSTNNVAFLAWDAVTDLDLSHYELRFQGVLSGAEWGSSSPVLLHVEGTTASVPLQIGTYLIKAVDHSGVKSTNATLAVTTVAQLEGLNVVTTITEDPTFGGTKTQCEVDTGALILSDGFSSGTYEFTSTFDLGEVQTSKVIPLIDVVGQDAGNLISTWGLISTLASLTGGASDEFQVILEIRTTEDDPTGAPTWSAWSEVEPGDYTFWGAEFRLQLLSFRSDVTPRVTGLAVEIDMPDRFEGADGVTASSGGSTVTYAEAFRVAPDLVITPIDLDEQEYFVVSNPTAADFDIQFFDSTDTGIAKDFNWIAKGFGRVG